MYVRKFSIKINLIFIAKSKINIQAGIHILYKDIVLEVIVVDVSVPLI